MYQRLYVPVLFIGLLLDCASSNGGSLMPFVDGRWNGGIERGPDGKGPEECWARTTFDDGTTFVLAERDTGSWYLRLSNPSWQLPPFHRYSMVALVDFYPQLRVAAEAKSRTHLEIANLDEISLLELIENGHAINLEAEGFNAKYDLEGSAKAIERVRHCFAG